MVTVLPRCDEVWLVNLDPTMGSEMKKTRPCLVVSPDVMNQRLRTVLVAPLTTAVRPYPTRITARFQSKAGQIALDQIRAVDQVRLRKKLGRISARVAESVSATLVEMFQRV